MIGLGIGLGLSEFRLPMVGFTPAKISGLAAWWDASDTTSTYQSAGGSLASADGDPVGQWMDKSGNSRHAVQADGVKKFTLKLGVKNGKSVVRAGIGDILQSPSFACYPSKRGTLFLVYANTGATSPVIYGTFNTGQFQIYSTKSGSPRYKMFDAALFNATNLDSASYEIQSFNRTADTTFKFRRNGTLENTWTCTNNQQATAERYIGGNFSGGSVDADFCEIIEYGVSLSDSDEAAVTAYLNAKWGVY